MKKILLIDDDPRNIFALGLVLKSRSYTYVVSKDGAGGIELLRADSGIGLVLLDMMMPDMDGYEVLSIIRQDPMLGKLPVIAVTGQAMTGDREKCLQAGASDYLSKPVNVDLLEQLLVRHLGHMTT